MSEDKWKWLPHPAHFIGADKCAFRLATVVGNGRYIVSTIGEYQAHDKIVPLGGDGRLYETMVFTAKKVPDQCCQYEPENYNELEMRPATDAATAQFNHMHACRVWDL